MDPHSYIAIYQPTSDQNRNEPQYPIHRFWKIFRITIILRSFVCIINAAQQEQEENKCIY